MTIRSTSSRRQDAALHHSLRSRPSGTSDSTRAAYTFTPRLDHGGNDLAEEAAQVLGFSAMPCHRAVEENIPPTAQGRLFGTLKPGDLGHQLGLDICLPFKNILFSSSSVTLSGGQGPRAHPQPDSGCCFARRECFPADHGQGLKIKDDLSTRPARSR